MRGGPGQETGEPTGSADRQPARKALGASVVEILGSGGPLRKMWPGFAPRLEQQAMAERVERAFARRGVLVCEAGTGTGKTFAYLVPALLSGIRTIVSTGTKTLQDQLFHRDLPRLREALAVPTRVRLLKGRANYLCLHRLHAHLEDSGSLAREVYGDLLRIERWGHVTRTGDIAGADGIEEGAPAWRYATSTVDNCLGQECPSFADCFVLKARRAASEADLLVVNHHLFFADMALREDGFGELLPGFEAVVLDEAHQVPAVATQFFGASLSGRQLLDLSRDGLEAYFQEAGDDPDLLAAIRAVETATREFRLALGVPSRRLTWRELVAEGGVAEAIAGLTQALDDAGARLEESSARGKELARCHQRSQLLRERLVEVTNDEQSADALRWAETSARGFVLRLTPLEIAETFAGAVRQRDCAWVLTSATIAVGESFSHFAGRLGLEDCDTARWDSPFDFSRQALCYLPRGLPDPGNPTYTSRVVAASLPVLAITEGRAFMLFTSHRALRVAAAELEREAAYPLLIQGERPRSQLIEAFRTTPNAVLLGTASFWEGVDVSGDALSCVIIDKLPFAPPDDPLVRARSERIRAGAGSPFRDLQLPEAVITLKQGVGRLIRDVKDRGVLVLCDPRLTTRGYGRVFLDSLPPMPRTREIEEVRGFFADQGSGRDNPDVVGAAGS